MNTYALHTDGLRAAASRLRAGDKVLLSGTVYTSRDAAHKRLFALMDEGKPLPFPLKDAGGWIFTRRACMTAAYVLL